MNFKRGVDRRFLSPQMWCALDDCNDIHRRLDEEGRDVTVTSTGEGKHSVKRSKHYVGDFGFGWSMAMDLRTWHVEKNEFAMQIRRKLGKHYVVVIEKTHLHIHYAPQYTEET